ncbi:MAG TPA: PepSY-associated TM helix domain-containing protein [Bacteroidales bacterium]|nr:PepSY-associated TM helix domain-containing protein [Bacteroidales bacterium]
MMIRKRKRKKQTKLLREFRKIHRALGAALFIFLFIVCTTGLMLGWKKNSGGLILPKTPVGTSTDLKNWLPLDSLHTIACNVLHDSVSSELSVELVKIDIRKKYGIVKFVFVDGYWGIQLDGTTGEVLNVQTRVSDLVEGIHDGSILDQYFGTTGGPIKLIYTSIMGLALLTFTITGFWLWYGPKRMKKEKHATENDRSD